MPEYLAPGVFVEEVSYRAKSIEGVIDHDHGLRRPHPLRSDRSRARHHHLRSSSSSASMAARTELESTRTTARRRQLYVERRARLLRGGRQAALRGAGLHGDGPGRRAVGLRDRRQPARRVPAVPAGHAGIRGPRALSRAGGRRPGSVHPPVGPEPPRGRRGRRRVREGGGQIAIWSGSRASAPTCCCGTRWPTLGGSMRLTTTWRAATRCSR